MRKPHLIHNHLTHNHIISLLNTSKTQIHAAQIHAQLLTANRLPNPLLHTQLINLYCQLQLTSHALLTFRSIRHHSNIITWTSLISHLSHSCQPFTALDLFSQLMQAAPALTPNHFTFSVVLSACAYTGRIAYGEQVHALACKLGLEADVFVANALLDMYAKCADIASSKKVFDEMPVRNLVNWNALVVGFTRNEQYETAMRTFKQMFEIRSTSLDEVSLSSVLSACANSCSELSFGRGVHASVIKIGLERAAYVNNSLIDMYSKSECFEEAVQLFNTCSDRDVVSWNVMMMGLVQSGRFEEACKYFWAMRVEGIVPDEASYSTSLHAYTYLATWANGAVVHNQIVKTGFEKNRCVESSLITMYAKCGSLDDAYRVFEQSRNSLNVVTWTAMIAAFQRHGHGDQVIKMFDTMLHEGITPDYMTFVCVLSACGHNGLIEQGFKYFSLMSSVHGMKPGSEHYACVVDMLGRAGRLDEAKSFIDAMPIAPDTSVWGALLSSCRNCNNLDMGREVAEKLFQIEPENPGNYVLLSNMYALHGRLEEAKEVRRLMRIKGVRKETGCSWIDIKNKTFVFTVRDRSHERTDEIYKMLTMLEEVVKQKGYVADTRYAMNDVGDEYKEQGLWRHSEGLAACFWAHKLAREYTNEDKEEPEDLWGLPYSYEAGFEDL